MKQIGENFKEQREKIGLSVEEAAKDMNVTIPQLENLEDGNVNAFKDIFFLKELVKKYAIYLNLDEEETMEEFNDFMFDFTSKIPVQEIESKIKEIEKEKEKETKNKISSPYTRKTKRKKKLNSVYYFAIITIVLVSLTLIILNVLLSDKKKEIFDLRSENIYEFTK